MSWFRNNVVGLISILLVLAGSLGGLYIKAEVNSRMLVEAHKTIETLSDNQAAQMTSLQGYAIRTTQLEGQIGRFVKTNDRLILALDKLDVLYGSLKVTDALQNERLSQLVAKIDRLENK